VNVNVNDDNSDVDDDDDDGIVFSTQMTTTTKATLSQLAITTVTSTCFVENTNAQLAAFPIENHSLSLLRYTST